MASKKKAPSPPATVEVEGNLEIVAPTVKLVIPAKIKNDFKAASHYATKSREHGMLAVAYRVMAGFELLRLHKVHGIAAGRPKKAGKEGDNCFTPETIKWPKLVMAQCQFSKATAHRAMEWAEAMMDHSKKLTQLIKTNAPAARILEFLKDETVGMSSKEFREMVGLFIPDAGEGDDEDESGPGFGGKTDGDNALNDEAAKRQETLDAWLETIGNLKQRHNLEDYKILDDTSLSTLANQMHEIAVSMENEITARRASEKKGGK